MLLLFNRYEAIVWLNQIYYMKNSAPSQCLSGLSHSILALGLVKPILELFSVQTPAVTCWMSVTEAAV